MAEGGEGQPGAKGHRSPLNVTYVCRRVVVAYEVLVSGRASGQLTVTAQLCRQMPPNRPGFPPLLWKGGRCVPSPNGPGPQPLRGPAAAQLPSLHSVWLPLDKHQTGPKLCIRSCCLLGQGAFPNR